MVRLFFGFKTMKKIFFLALIIMLSSQLLKAQDTLRWLNGNVSEVSIGTIGDREITFLPYRTNKKSFSIREKNLLFSYTKEGGKEIMVYKYNPEIGNIYQEQEMRDYIIGEQHADQYYSSRLYNYLSFAGGVASGYLVSKEDNLLAVTAPLLFSSIIIIPGARVKKNELNKDLSTNLAYKEGYKRVAKGKKFINSLKYGGMGLVGSILYFELLD